MKSLNPLSNKLKAQRKAEKWAVLIRDNYIVAVAVILFIVIVYISLTINN